MTRLARAKPSLSLVWSIEVLALLHGRHELGRRDGHLVDAELAQPGELAVVAAAAVLGVGEGEDVLVVERSARRSGRASAW